MRQIFPSPEGKIRKRMAQLQELTTFSGTEGNLAQIAVSQKLSSLFTEDAKIRLTPVVGGHGGTLTGREDIMNASVGARQLLGGLKVDFLDVVVTIEPGGRTALVEATGKAVPKGSGEMWVQELRFHFIETEEGWMISSVETVRTLTLLPVEPISMWRLARAV